MTKNNLRIILIGILLIAAIIATITHNPKSPGSEESGTSSITPPHAISLSVNQLDDGWAYEIYIDSTLFIFQENIPGLSGNQKFISRKEALLCGELAIQKLKQKQLPTINKAELDSLGITFEY